MRPVPRSMSTFAPPTLIPIRRDDAHALVSENFTSTSTPCSAACSSVSPTEASGGFEKTTLATAAGANRASESPRIPRTITRA